MWAARDRWDPLHGPTRLQLLLLLALEYIQDHSLFCSSLSTGSRSPEQLQLTTNLQLPCCRCSCCLTLRHRPASAMQACCTPAAATGRPRSGCLCPPWLTTLRWQWATQFSSSEEPCLITRWAGLGWLLAGVRFADAWLHCVLTPIASCVCPHCPALPCPALHADRHRCSLGIRHAALHLHPPGTHARPSHPRRRCCGGGQDLRGRRLCQPDGAGYVAAGRLTRAVHMRRQACGLPFTTGVRSRGWPLADMHHPGVVAGRCQLQIP